MANKIRRINLIGSPGNGKSTVAASLFGRLKIKRYNIELVTEFVKSWAAESKEITYWDQLHIFGQQHQLEYHWLKNNTDLIITDCPLFIPIVYTKDFVCNDGLADNLFNIYQEYEKAYPSLNILLYRDINYDYDSRNRYHTEEESMDIQENIIRELNDSNISFKIFVSSQIDEMEKYINANL